MVIHGDVFANAILGAIESQEIRALPVISGSVSQFVDSTDILTKASLCKKLKSYENNDPDLRAHATVI
ncbi:MAG: hypothetical protein M1570_02850 [Chloroflexi bacterium]|nr:hypothetical protein [Chloroflexota bacterium]